MHDLIDHQTLVTKNDHQILVTKNILNVNFANI